MFSKIIRINEKTIVMLDAMRISGKQNLSYDVVINQLLTEFLIQNSEGDLWQRFREAKVRQALKQLEQQNMIPRIEDKDLFAIICILHKSIKRGIAILFNEHPEIKEVFMK